MKERPLGLRWTIGEVAEPGYEALRLAVWGAWKVFGADAAFTVCVNSLPAAEVRRRAGNLPPVVEWREASGRLPAWLRPYVDAGMAEGKAWKFDPLQVYPGRWEIAFDNDCILWEMPPSVRAWLREGDPERCLIAADVAACHGAFSSLTGSEPRNSGIRGVPPGFGLESVMRRLLAESGVVLASELDEQGLQVAAVSRLKPPTVVPVDEVAITSPFPPHLPGLGRCGAHFVGLNDRHLPWDYYGRPATEYIREHWERHRDELYRRVGIPRPEEMPGSRRVAAEAADAAG
jgi:hypothetical protein